ncbi:MAG: cytochrome P450 [Cyanobacteria bacterium P01_H01_bin.15]
MTSSPVQTRLNPYNATFRQNPYPTFARLRAEDPIHLSVFNVWTATRYDDARQCLRDARLKTATLPQGIANRHPELVKRGQSSQELADTTQNFLFFRDPPDHGRMRSLVMPAFNMGSIQAIQPYVEEVVANTLETLKPQGTGNAIADFAIYVPGLTICKLMGLPGGDHLQLHKWSKQLFRVFDPLLPLGECAEMNEAALGFADYLRYHLDQKRNNPGDDCLSALLHIEKDGDRLSEKEIIDLGIMTFVAGERTTVAAIGGGLYGLLQFPAQLQLLRDNPKLARNAAEEALRFESPTQYLMRTATEAFELRGRQIEEGQNVLVCLGGANRDPLQFENPEQLDIQRKNANTHIAFAAGIHFCIGAGLARMELPLALAGLVQALPNLTGDLAAVEWEHNITLRCLRSLKLTWNA